MYCGYGPDVPYSASQSLGPELTGNPTVKAPERGHAALLGVDNTAHRLLVERLDGRITLRRFGSPNQLFAAMEHAGLQADALVLGVQLEQPVRVVQRVHGFGLDIPVLVMTEPARYEQFSQALKFAPFIGNDVKSWCCDSLETLPRVLTEAVNRAQKRRQFKGSMAEAQRHLGKLPGERPQVTHYFQRLLDRAPIGVLNVDVQGTILSLNRYACRVFEVNERETLGTAVSRFLPEEEHHRLRDIIARCVAPMSKRVPEILAIQSQGGLARHVEVIASSLVDRTGQLGATLIFQDVTARVQAERRRQRAEDALRSSEERYRELIQTMNEALAMTDQDYHITFVNRSFCEMFGYSVNEVLGRPLLDLVHPDNQAMVAKRMAAKDDCPARRFETAWLARDGHSIYTLTSPRTFVDAEGHFAGCLGVFTDITDRKRVEEELRNSEAQLRLVTDAIPMLIVYLDREQRLRFVNRAFTDWYRVERDKSIGLHLADLIGDLAYRTMRPSIEAALDGQTVECEQSLVVPDQVERDVRCAFVPDMDDASSLHGLVAVISDITESKHIEQWERTRLQELAHVSRITTIGEMSSQIAHELAQPLTAISAMSTALSKLLKTDRATRDDIGETLSEISMQSSRAREIIIRLRDFVRNEEVRHIPIDINDLIRTVVRLAEPEVRHRSMEMVLELVDDLPRMNGDRILIEQVLLNLVRNAMDAMFGHGDGVHRLTIRCAADGKEWQEVSVSDTGPGLSADLKSKIFEPFFTTKADGMGMGLAITRSVIEAHGGRLRVECNPSGGATFRFSLPVETDTDSEP